MCRDDVGELTPMPTFTLLAAPFTPAMLPSTRELLLETRLCEPIAVAVD
jgi:hypothetical protein